MQYSWFYEMHLDISIVHLLSKLIVPSFLNSISIKSAFKREDSILWIRLFVRCFSKMSALQNIDMITNNTNTGQLVNHARLHWHLFSMMNSLGFILHTMLS